MAPMPEAADLNIGPATETETWSWEFTGTTTDPERYDREARERDMLAMVIPIEQAAAAPRMLDALKEVNDYLTRYERKEEDIDYVFRARHSVREAIATASQPVSA